MIRAVVLALLTIVACTSCQSAARDQGFVSGDGTVSTFPTAQRKPVPTLNGKDLAGQRLSTDRFSNKIIVVNVWGSWCAPCRKEAPELVQAAQQTGEVAAFVGLNTRDHDPAPAQAFVRSFQLPFPSFFDPDGELLVQLAKDVPPNAIPSTLVLDRRGRVAARIVGATTSTTLVGIVHDLAKEGS